MVFISISWCFPYLVSSYLNLPLQVIKMEKYNVANWEISGRFKLKNGGKKAKNGFCNFKKKQNLVK